MAKKKKGGSANFASSKGKVDMSGPSVFVKNYCLECGAEAQIVKFAKSKEKGRPSGMLWVCKENSEHINRTRRYELYEPKRR